MKKENIRKLFEWTTISFTSFYICMLLARKQHEMELGWSFETAVNILFIFCLYYLLTLFSKGAGATYLEKRNGWIVAANISCSIFCAYFVTNIVANYTNMVGEKWWKLFCAFSVMNTIVAITATETGKKKELEKRQKKMIAFQTKRN